MDTIEREEYKGFVIKVLQDDCPESPREWDNLGTMTCFHPRYNLGDKHYMVVDEMLEIVARKDVLALPLALLDHSGLWMKVGYRWAEDPGGWDSSRVGFIYVTYEELRKEYGVKNVTKRVLIKAENTLRAEVEVYSSYLEGSVYGYEVVDKDGESIDSCWGYYGTEGYKEAFHQAMAIVDSLVDGELWKRSQMEQMELFGGEVG
jgi:hypothetical protein